MNRPSLKKETIRTFAGAAAIPEFQDDLLVVVTPAGLITGHPVAATVPNNSTSDTVSDILTALDTVSKKYADTYHLEFPLADNDGYIILNDVTHYTGGSTNKLSYLIVFIDQIVGISTGKIQP